MEMKYLKSEGKFQIELEFLKLNGSKKSKKVISNLMEIYNEIPKANEGNLRFEWNDEDGAILKPEFKSKFNELRKLLPEFEEKIEIFEIILVNEAEVNPVGIAEENFIENFVNNVIKHLIIERLN